ncbi:TonB-dependent receptor [Microvirga sp. W0021]|uniref:TonB-dependent receptor n=1 Tax=Hohaiivirga grylli TaxID=3133970 RepID=A0ABV0BFZ3_9HYPH
MVSFSRRLLAASLSTIVVSVPLQSALADDRLPEIVITATRSPTAISDSGSAISVITADEIAKNVSNDISGVLRSVPGLDVNTSGGPGSVTSVRIRGAESKNTLVLIDGIRMNDPADTGGGFDFSGIVPVDIERIEVLRGPQSALYGSDAMGGVINIITKRGKGKPRVTVSAEGGSYGSKGLKASVSGSNGPVSYAFSVSGYDTDGYSRYGYRIKRITKDFPRKLERDPSKQLGLNGRLVFALNDTTELEIGGYSSLNVSDYDSGWGDFPDTPSRSRQGLLDGYVRLKNLMFNGRLTNQITISGNVTDRRYRAIDFYSYGYGAPEKSWAKDYYRGKRIAAEYQGDLKLDQFGTFTFGAKTEKEFMTTHHEDVLPYPSARKKTASYDQVTNSVYAIHQISPIKNLSLSLGGRIDAVEDGKQFNTWRATAAYDITATDTIVRASIGTGAKAPTLFQLNDPLYGNPDLRPEYSLGFDAGIDQYLFDRRVKLSATYFANRFRNLIDFTFDPDTCPTSSYYGCYLNVNRARTHGLELSGTFEIVPDLLSVKANYTYMRSINAETHQKLARRPEHEGRIAFTITPTRQLTIEPSIVFVGERFSSANEVGKLAPYARLDAHVEYKIDDIFTVYVRGENLTNAHYQEVLNYGTPGRSVYGGLRASW